MERDGSDANASHERRIWGDQLCKELVGSGGVPFLYYYVFYESIICYIILINCFTVPCVSQRVTSRFLSFFAFDSFNARMWKVSRHDINV